MKQLGVQVLQKTFHNVEIEDLWLPYVCTSTDIQHFETKATPAGLRSLLLNSSCKKP